MGIRNFRNMGILEIQQLVSQGYLRLIKDTTVSVATTSVTIDTDENSQAFSFGKDSTLLLVSDIVTDSTDLYSLYVNNNTTGTNYYMQQVFVDGTTVSGARINQSRLAIGDIETANDNVLSIAEIKLTNDGYFTFNNPTSRAYNTTGLNIMDIVVSSTFTVTSMTRFDIVVSLANKILAGSRFMLLEVIQ